MRLEGSLAWVWMLLLTARTLSAESIVVTESAVECQRTERILTCNFDKQDVVLNEQVNSTVIKQVYIFNAKKVHFHESVCVSVSLHSVENVIVVGSYKINNCSGRVDFFAEKSIIDRLPFHSNNINIDESVLVSLHTAIAGEHLVITNSMIHTVNLVNPLQAGSSAHFLNSKIKKIEKLHTEANSSLLIRNCEIDMIQSDGLILNGGEVTIHVTNLTSMSQNSLQMNKLTSLTLGDLTGNIQIKMLPEEESYLPCTTNTSYLGAFIVCLCLNIAMFMFIAYKNYFKKEDAYKTPLSSKYSEVNIDEEVNDIKCDSDPSEVGIKTSCNKEITLNKVKESYNAVIKQTERSYDNFLKHNSVFKQYCLPDNSDLKNKAKKYMKLNYSYVIDICEHLTKVQHILVNEMITTKAFWDMVKLIYTNNHNLIQEIHGFNVKENNEGKVEENLPLINNSIEQLDAVSTGNDIRETIDVPTAIIINEKGNINNEVNNTGDIDTMVKTKKSDIKNINELYTLDLNTDGNIEQEVEATEDVQINDNNSDISLPNCKKIIWRNKRQELGQINDKTYAKVLEDIKNQAEETLKIFVAFNLKHHICEKVKQIYEQNYDILKLSVDNF